MPSYAGSGHCCCCDKCHKLEACGDSAGCCACYPKWICVTLTMDDPIDGCTDCSCGETRKQLTLNCTDHSYSGTITCGDLSVDVKFEAVLDGDGDCTWCLSSTCLSLTCATPGWTGAKKMNVPADDSPADATGPSCKTLAGTWSVDVSGCGSSYCDNATITTEAPEYITWNDCDMGVCCACIPCKLCIQHSRIEGDCLICSDTAIVEWDAANKWWSHTFTCDGDSVDVKIEIVDVGGTCKLRRTSTWFGNSDTTWTDCPNVSLSFSKNLGGTPPQLDFIDITDKWCGPCAPNDHTPCGDTGCCMELQKNCAPVSNDLTLSITSNCSLLSGYSGTLNAHASTCQKWELNNGTPVSMGSCTIGGDLGVTLTMSAVFYCELSGGDPCTTENRCMNYRLDLGWGTSGCPDADGGVAKYPDSCTCDPVSFTFSGFTLPWHATQCNCCNSSDTLTITVTV